MASVSLGSVDPDFTAWTSGPDPQEKYEGPWNEDKQERVDEALQNVGFAIQTTIVISRLGKKAYQLGKWVAHGGKAAVKTASKGSRVAQGVFKAFVFLAIPIAFKELYEGCRSVVTGDLSERVDGTLQIVESTALFVEGTIATAEMLADFGAVSSDAISWADPLGVVAAALSGVTIFVNAKALWDTARFKKKINHHLEKGDEIAYFEFRDLINLIQIENNKKLGKRLQVNPVKFKDRMQKIKNIVDQRMLERKEEEAQELMAQTVKLIKTRIFRKQMKHSVGLVASVVSTVGLAVLLFTPAAPVGYALLGVAAAVSLGKVIYDYLQTRKFKKQTKELAQEQLIKEGQVEMQTQWSVSSVSRSTRTPQAIIVDSDDEEDDDDDEVVPARSTQPEGGVQQFRLVSEASRSRSNSFNPTPYDGP